MVDPITITGMSCISGLGIGKTAFEEAVFAGRTALAPVTAFDTANRRSHVAAEIADFDPAQFIPPAKLRRIDRIGRLAVACCRLTLADAGLAERQAGGDDHIGVAVGSHTAGLHSLVDYLDKLIALGPPGASAMDFSNTVGNAAASLCGIEFGLRGANVTLNYREASALSAVAYAMSLLREGQTRIVVTGGVDDIESVLFAVHDEFGVLASDEGHGETSRPFDRRRNGFVLGSGAYFLILESLSSARDRGAPYYGQIAGVGATASRCRLNDWPREASQLARCMRDALDSARLHPQDIDVVFAAANSTTRLDRLEAEALSRVFGPAGVPVVALKGALGECGATGAASLLAALQCLQRGVIPPTVGFEEPDAECPVDIAADARPLRRSPGQLALVNSFASGGANYSIVVRR